MATPTLTPGTVDPSLINTNRNLQTIGTTPPDATSGGANLFSSLDSAFAPTANTILENYNKAKALTTQSTANLNAATSDKYNQDIAFQQKQDQNSGTSMQEAGRGFVINPGAIVAFQQQADKRVKDLRNQMNDALLANNAQGAKALSDLIVNEQSAITNARSSFLNQYFGAQQESRAEQSFQTPATKAVQDLATTYTDAGILPTDDLQTATAKVKNSRIYQQNLAKGQADITNALAQAGLAGAQASQINTILDTLKKSGQYDSDVSGLVSGSTSDATLHAKYDNYPGGLGGAIIAQIESEAQSKGWSPQKSLLSTEAQQANARALGGGGYGALSTGATNVFGNFLGSAFGSNPISVPALSPLLNPVVGQIQTANGKTYKFDGALWQPQ